MKNFIIGYKKGASFRVRDIESGLEYRLFGGDNDKIDCIVGTLFKNCKSTISGDLLIIDSFDEEVLGDTKKERIIVDTATTSIGDLIDGIPIFNLGAKFAKDGKKCAYAYFK